MEARNATFPFQEPRYKGKKNGTAVAYTRTRLLGHNCRPKARK